MHPLQEVKSGGTPPEQNKRGIIMEYTSMNGAALAQEKEQCLHRLREYEKRGMTLDLSRGKPAAEQLALSLKLLDELDHRSILDSESGQDCRNYGGLDGIPEAKRLLAHMMGTHASHTIVGGNSSLTLMYQIISHGMTEGICGGTPWQAVPGRKFLCPVPGYDRHFAITEHFGFQLIPVPMDENGPDMALVERLVQDETVKGIWCVPKYQNPTGIVFSDDVVRRFADLRPAAADFRIFWDNAYCVHCFDGECAQIPDIIEECEKAGHPDLVYEFCSTSKVTFPGSGIAAVAASAANLIDIKSFLQLSTIGPDKLNQLRHARFFKNDAGLLAHMKKHAAILKPKFDTVLEVLDTELAGTGVARWTTPKGGYFLSFDTLPGCAAEVVKLCAANGVKFTPAGATYPYGRDPEDRNIRLAPSFATVEEIRAAVTILALCTKLVSIEKLEKERS